MKTNKFLLTLTLCAGLQFSTHAAEQPETQPAEQSYWQMYAPQFAQNAATTTSTYVASWIPQSVKDTVNKWSTRKKLAVASAIIASLAAIYNREAIWKIVNDAIGNATLKPEFIPHLSTQDVADIQNNVKKRLNDLKSPIMSDMEKYYTDQEKKNLRHWMQSKSRNTHEVEKYILESYLFLKGTDNKWLQAEYPELK